MNFSNLTVNLNILYVFNMHVKFYSNSILFTIQLIILFFLCHKIVKFKYLIDDIKINFWFSFWNFVNIKNRIKTYNLPIKFAKFKYNKNI